VAAERSKAAARARRRRNGRQLLVLRLLLLRCQVAVLSILSVGGVVVEGLLLAPWLLAAGGDGALAAAAAPCAPRAAICVGGGGGLGRKRPESRGCAPQGARGMTLLDLSRGSRGWKAGGDCLGFELGTLVGGRGRRKLGRGERETEKALSCARRPDLKSRARAAKTVAKATSIDGLPFATVCAIEGGLQGALR
jgi:hypothetical protein